MRYLSLVFLVVINTAFGQKISGVSSEINISIESQGSIEGLSNPKSIKIRYKSVSGLSEPIQLNVGESSNIAVVKYNFQNRGEIEKLDEPLSGITSVPEYYSLIIGINEYKNSNANLRDLNEAVGDAKLLRQTLIEKYNFKENNSVLLSDPTRQEILNELENLAKRITDRDNLMIFYAGHGIWDERIKVGYWIPSDGQIKDKTNWISNSTIRDYIAGINSKHTLLISDACFSGSILRTRGAELNTLGMASLYRMSSRQAMTSGTLTTVPDESKFMYYLVKKLNEFEGEFLSSKQLFYGIETAILNNTRTVPQFGVIQDSGDEGGDFIFIRKK